MTPTSSAVVTTAVGEPTPKSVGIAVEGQVLSHTGARTVSLVIVGIALTLLGVALEIARRNRRELDVERDRASRLARDLPQNPDVGSPTDIRELLAQLARVRQADASAPELPLGPGWF
jgi:hypothetical protein